MNKKSSAKWPLRMILFCFIFGSLLISSPKQRAKAVGDYSCEHLQSFCLYDCAVACDNDVDCYATCEAQCELDRNSCDVCTADDLPPDCDGAYEIPEPYPIVADFTMCMDNCGVCNFLPLAKRSACFVPCKADCIALYAN